MPQFCTECGQKLLDNAKFCANCGAPVANPGASLPSATAGGGQAVSVERDVEGDVNVAGRDVHIHQVGDRSKLVDCPTCQGSGEVYKWVTCPRCKGGGLTVAEYLTPSAQDDPLAPPPVTKEPRAAGCPQCGAGQEIRLDLLPEAARGELMSKATQAYEALVAEYEDDVRAGSKELDDFRKQARRSKLSDRALHMEAVKNDEAVLKETKAALDRLLKNRDNWIAYEVRQKFTFSPHFRSVAGTGKIAQPFQCERCGGLGQVRL